MARATAPLASPGAPTTPPESAAPSAARLRLATGRVGRGVMDGGWWPRSRDAATELAELLTALYAPPETAASVTIDFDDWDDIPLRVTILGQEVRVGWLACRDHMVSVTYRRADPILLLVIPPGAAPASAETALTRSAVETGGATSQRVLASCDISTRRG